MCVCALRSACVCVRRWEGVSYLWSNMKHSDTRACAPTHRARMPAWHACPRAPAQARAAEDVPAISRLGAVRLHRESCHLCQCTAPNPTFRPRLRPLGARRLALPRWFVRLGTRAHIRAVCGVCRCRRRRVASFCLRRSSRCRSPTSCAKVRKPGSSRACAAPDGVAVFASQCARGCPAQRRRVRARGSTGPSNGQRARAHPPAQATTRAPVCARARRQWRTGAIIGGERASWHGGAR